MDYGRHLSEPARSVGDVLEHLEEIIERSNRERNRLGVFASLYRQTTLRIKHGIESGQFIDGQRMAHLDVAFANRYLEAVRRFRLGQQPSRCWLVCFEAACNHDPSTVRHLLLGMNAHINFDLAIATVETCRGLHLANLKPDFDQINLILMDVFTKVSPEIDEESSCLELLRKAPGRLDDALVSLCLSRARARAWRIANGLATSGRGEWNRTIRRLDRQVAFVARLINGAYRRSAPEAR